MKNIQIFTDKMAIGLSLICTIHCLAFPLIIVLLPNLAALQLDNEAFHLWMVLAVIPTSAFALTVGCKQHKKYSLIPVGLAGLTCLILAVVLGESLLGEYGEKILTAIGAGIITFGHYRNYRLCKRKESCPCPGTNNEPLHET